MKMIKGREVKEVTEAAKEARREYRRKWYEQNRDRVKGYNAKYWERKANEQAVNERRDNGARRKRIPTLVNG